MKIDLLLDITLGNSWVSTTINENMENTCIRDSILIISFKLNRVRFRDIDQLSLYQINTLFVSVVDET